MVLYCYPNPAADAAAVRLNRPVAGTLLDALDHTVYQLPTATDCLDVRGLPAGLSTCCTLPMALPAACWFGKPTE